MYRKQEGLVKGHDEWPNRYYSREGCGNMVSVAAEEMDNPEDGREINYELPEEEKEGLKKDNKSESSGMRNESCSGRKELGLGRKVSETGVVGAR